MRNSLALFLISLTVFSQTEPTSFSLEDAVNYALLNNKSSLDSQNNVRLAELQKWQTTSTGLPQISADISYNNQLKQQILLVPSAFLGGDAGEYSELSFGACLLYTSRSPRDLSTSRMPSSA